MPPEASIEYGTLQLARTQAVARVALPRRSNHTLLRSALGSHDLSSTVAASVAARLRERIVSGELPGGTPLVLVPLSKSLNVSVMPVREALRVLESEGLVVVRPRRGSLVSDPSVEEAEEIYAIRIALESLCARYATARLSRNDVTDLHEAYALMASAASSKDVHSFSKLDLEFHLRLYRVSGRERLVKSIDDLMARSLRYIPYLHRSTENYAHPLEAHQPLLSAIELRDVQLVESLTRTHMERAWAEIQAAIQHSVDLHGGHGERPHHRGAKTGMPNQATRLHGQSIGGTRGGARPDAQSASPEQGVASSASVSPPLAW
jgi:DNA-binding GntR family transcriptional regulator